MADQTAQTLRDNHSAGSADREADGAIARRTYEENQRLATATGAAMTNKFFIRRIKYAGQQWVVVRVTTAPYKHRQRIGRIFKTEKGAINSKSHLEKREGLQ